MPVSHMARFNIECNETVSTLMTGTNHWMSREAGRDYGKLCCRVSLARS